MEEVLGIFPLPHFQAVSSGNIITVILAGDDNPMQMEVSLSHPVASSH